MTDYQRLISGFYFIYYASAATLLPNLPLIFDDAGYSGSQIGWLLALPPAMSIVAAPTWGAVADATGVFADGNNFNDDQAASDLEPVPDMKPIGKTATLRPGLWNRATP